MRGVVANFSRWLRKPCVTMPTKPTCTFWVSTESWYVDTKHHLILCYLELIDVICRYFGVLLRGLSSVEYIKLCMLLAYYRVGVCFYCAMYHLWNSNSFFFFFLVLFFPDILVFLIGLWCFIPGSHTVARDVMQGNFRFSSSITYLMQKTAVSELSTK